MSIHNSELIDQEFSIGPQENYRKNVTLVLLARLCERTGFYGFHGCIVYFLSQGVLQWSIHEGAEIFPVLSTGIIVTSLLGGLLGDFVTGYRNAAMIGAACLAAGMACLSLQIASEPNTYIALGLIILGAGIYAPNLYAILSTSLAQIPVKMDAGFTLLLLITNVGSFLGTYFIVKLSFGNLTYAFIACAVANLIALICIYFSDKQPSANQAESKPKQGNKYIFIYIVMFGTAVFWCFYELSAYGIYLKYNKLSGSYLVEETFGNLAWIINHGTSVYDTFLTVIFGITLTLIWSFTKRSNSSIKLIRGFLLIMIGLLVLVTIPSATSTFYLVVFMVVTAIFAFAKLHITPIILSLIGQKAPDKYKATFFGGYVLLCMLLNMGILFLAPIYFETRYDGVLAITSAIIVTALISAILFILHKQAKTNIP